MDKRSTFNWSLTVAMAGFLFGFDTVVISGADQPIQKLWNTSPAFHGFFIMSMALWGTVIGALFGGWPCNRFGRKRTLFYIGLLFFVSAIGSAFAWDPYSFSFFRFIGGVGVGASSVAAPTYISEIVSAEKRGRTVALYQFMLVFGIFVAFFSNYLLKGVGGENDWRWMLGVEAVPAFVYSILVLSVPNSPRWLAVVKNQKEKALDVLKRLHDKATAEQELDEILHSHNLDARESVFSKKYMRVLGIAFVLAMFNQLSGINFILYYAPRILETAGLAAKESLFSSTLIGGINLIFTLVGMYLIDRAGRKQLLLYGSIGYVLSLAMVAYSFYSGASPTFLLVFILLFIASHAIGQGAVIWVLISEIFPSRVRAYGQSWGTGTHWVFAALITLFGPIVLDVFSANPWPIFAFFSAMMILQLLWVIFKVPETKGISLEKLEEDLVG